MSQTPVFVGIGKHLLNATQIKRVGIHGGGVSSHPEEVYVEFISGGTAHLGTEVSLADFRIALHQALAAQ